MDKKSDEIVILGSARTPIGNFQGVFNGTPASDLGAHSIRATLERSRVAAEQVDAVIMGCVLSAGQGQAPARQATLGAGLSGAVEATTVNKMCGSALKSVMLAHDIISAGSSDVIIAGGLENMTLAPYLLEKARSGYRLGHGTISDHLFLDGLEDAYDKGKLMGVFAEATAEKYGFSRGEQDDFAIASVKKAQEAVRQGHFKSEIQAIELKTKKGVQTIVDDEGPQTAQIDKIPSLKPAFKTGGTVTAANASSISDGAASVMLMRASRVAGLPVEARIVAHATHAHEPAWFTTAPVGAIQKVLQKAKLSIKDIDLFEINEAFAVVTLAAMADLKLPPDRVNVHGGACVLGHPIGASGARILVTLIHALKTHGLKRGLASLCIGGGEAVALIIERV